MLASETTSIPEVNTYRLLHLVVRYRGIKQTNAVFKQSTKVISKSGIHDLSCPFFIVDVITFKEDSSYKNSSTNT